MDVRDLEVFVQVYESRSLTAAARARHVSRQALSKALSHLEAQIGPLFERRPRGVEPTALGRAAYPHACLALAELGALAREAAEFARGRAGALRLAVEANAALTMPAGLFDDYAAARPGTAFSPVILSPSAARDALLSGEADAVLAGPLCGAGAGVPSCAACGAACASGPHAGLLYEPIFSSELVVVFAREAFGPGELDGAELRPGGGAAVVGESALAGRTVLGIDPENFVERRLRPYLAAHAPTARLAYGTTDAALTASQMRSGQGGILVEAGGAREDYGSGRYVHVRLRGDDAPVWEVGLTCRIDTPAVPVVHDFVAFARARLAPAAPAVPAPR